MYNPLSLNGLTYRKDTVSTKFTGALPEFEPHELQIESRGIFLPLGQHDFYLYLTYLVTLSIKKYLMSVYLRSPFFYHCVYVT